MTRHAHIFPLAGPLDPVCALGCGKTRSEIIAENDRAVRAPRKRAGKLKRASYRDAVDFIAQNDDPEAHYDDVPGTATVVLVAAIFGTTSERVAADVIRLRKRLNKT